MLCPDEPAPNLGDEGSPLAPDRSCQPGVPGVRRPPLLGEPSRLQLLHRRSLLSRQIVEPRLSSRLFSPVALLSAILVPSLRVTSSLFTAVYYMRCLSHSLGRVRRRRLVQQRVRVGNQQQGRGRVLPAGVETRGHDVVRTSSSKFKSSSLSYVCNIINMVMMRTL